MIGIGVITYNRPKHLELFLKQIEKHTKDYSLYVHDDSIERKGIAYGSNMCLHNLKDCEHIFLFNDDCFPIADGWAEYFINSKLNHSLYMNGEYSPILQQDNYTSYKHASGVFMHLTKKVVERVGYFNPLYDKYGFEHAAYSHRICRAGLIRSRFISLNDCNKYLYALDLQGDKGYEYLEHKRTLTDTEKNEQIQKNNETYLRETSINKVYYEFENII